MAKTALNQLQEQIESVRREAFAEGYRAAMEAVRELTAKPAPGTQQAPAPAQRRARGSGRGRGRRATAASAQATPQRQARSTTRSTRRTTASAGQRPQRGNNARLIEEVLQSMGSRAVRPAEIRTALQRDKGVSMAFTSIRHALGQLESRHAVEQGLENGTWRYRGGGASSGAD